MSVFTLAISCLITSNLLLFMVPGSRFYSSFQVPMQYCSLQHGTLLLSPVTSTTGCCFLFDKLDSSYWLSCHGSGCFMTLQAREAFLWMPRNWSNKYSFRLMQQNTNVREWVEIRKKEPRLQPYMDYLTISTSLRDKLELDKIFLFLTLLLQMLFPHT